MTSAKENNIFKETLSEFKSLLYNLPTKEQVLGKCIKGKLDNSYDNYAKNLEKTYKYLLKRSNLKVLKTIDREQKKALKQTNEELEDEFYEEDEYGE